MFNVGIGQADPVLLALTKAETNMITGGSLKNRAFQAVKLGFRVYYDTNVAASNADDVLETLSWVLNNTSVDFRLGAQDVQTLGNLTQWPMTSNTHPRRDQHLDDLHPAGSFRCSRRGRERQHRNSGLFLRVRHHSDSGLMRCSRARAPDVIAEGIGARSGACAS